MFVEQNHKVTECLRLERKSPMLKGTQLSSYSIPRVTILSRKRRQLFLQFIYFFLTKTVFQGFKMEQQMPTLYSLKRDQRKMTQILCDSLLSNPKTA